MFSKRPPKKLVSVLYTKNTNTIKQQQYAVNIS